MPTPIRSLALFFALLLAVPAMAADPAPHTHYLRGAYQYGSVLPTNDFFTGKNQTGENIDRYHTARLEFGWQTGGQEDWHHIYNFPSYGVGLHFGDYFDEEELGKPSSLYGFFSWPVKRWERRSLNVDFGFGMASNWQAFDPDLNPYNMVIGAGRSVYIDVGANYELPLAKRWWLLLGFTGTHYSNGGTQSPNAGVNQVGALAFVKYDLQERRIPAERSTVAPRQPGWEHSATASWGIRNLDLDLRHIPAYGVYLDKDYTVVNLMTTMTRRLSHISAWDCGLDLAYDGSVGDLKTLDAIKREAPMTSTSFLDYLNLSAFGGYEHIVNDTRLIVQVGYTFLRYEVDGQVPRLYQRLGLKQQVWKKAFVGLNVRFNDFSRANNLEINAGYRFSP